MKTLRASVSVEGSVVWLAGENSEGLEVVVVVVVVVLVMVCWVKLCWLGGRRW